MSVVRGETRVSFIDVIDRRDTMKPVSAQGLRGDDVVNIETRTLSGEQSWKTKTIA